MNLNLADLIFFAIVDSFEASTCMHVTSTWKQYLISLCLLTYLIKILGEYSTVHFSVTLQSKFWMSASRILLFVGNFGAWKMQFGSLKVLEKCLHFVLCVCYEPCSEVSLCCVCDAAVGWSGSDVARWRRRGVAGGTDVAAAVPVADTGHVVQQVSTCRPAAEGTGRGSRRVAQNTHSTQSAGERKCSTHWPTRSFHFNFSFILVF